MWSLIGLALLALAFPAAAQERPVRPAEIDPNTKIQGGASSEKKSEAEPRVGQREDAARPEKTDPKEDKPISERKPQEREREDAAKGDTALPRR